MTLEAVFPAPWQVCHPKFLRFADASNIGLRMVEAPRLGFHDAESEVQLDLCPKPP